MADNALEQPQPLQQGAPEIEPAGQPVAQDEAGSVRAEAQGEGVAAGGELAGEAASDEQLSPEELEELRANETAFSWQASEYVHHHKSAGWYAALGGGLVVLVAMAVWLHYWLEIGAFLVMAVAILVYARKSPRTLLYELSPTGITIDGRQFNFSEFRSFGVLPDVEWHTIDLEPAKRFSPRMTLLFDDEDFDSIVGHLELHLPRVDRRPDLIERISRSVRF